MWHLVMTKEKMEAQGLPVDAFAFIALVDRRVALI